MWIYPWRLISHSLNTFYFLKILFTTHCNIEGCIWIGCEYHYFERFIQQSDCLNDYDPVVNTPTLKGIYNRYSSHVINDLVVNTITLKGLYNKRLKGIYNHHINEDIYNIPFHTLHIKV
jgi:hypothetical protein